MCVGGGEGGGERPPLWSQPEVGKKTRDRFSRAGMRIEKENFHQKGTYRCYVYDPFFLKVYERQGSMLLILNPYFVIRTVQFVKLL